VPRLAVIGHPVAHSRSPAMQNAALEALGLEDWSYEAVDVRPDDFPEKVREMAAGDFAGVNVTIPHKEAAVAAADVLTREAMIIGAANTLVFSEEGIVAHNTDAGGLMGAVRQVAAPRGRRALVLGAGGAARAAVWALNQEGAVVDVWNRTARRAASLFEELSSSSDLGGAPVESPRQEIYGIVVNTTAVGLHGEDPFEELPLERSAFAEQVVVDMVYGERPSALLAAAQEAGATTVDGLEILVQQGARSLEIWTGRKPDLDVMRAAVR